MIAQMTEMPMRAISRRRMCVLLGIVNGFSSRVIADFFTISKRQIDDDALWWQSKLHAQNRSELTKIALQLHLFDERELRFDGSQDQIDAFYERIGREPSRLYSFAEGRIRVDSLIEKK